MRLARSRSSGPRKEAERLLEGYGENPLALVAVARLRVLRQKPANAAAMIERRLDELEPGTPETAVLLAILVDARLALDDLDGAAAAAQRLEQLGERLHRDNLRALGLLAQRTSRSRAATQAHSDARGGARPLRPARHAVRGGRGRLRLADALRQSGSELAADEARSALGAFEALGAAGNRKPPAGRAGEGRAARPRGAAPRGGARAGAGGARGRGGGGRRARGGAGRARRGPGARCGVARVTCAASGAPEEGRTERDDVRGDERRARARRGGERGGAEAPGAARPRPGARARARVGRPRPASRRATPTAAGATSQVAGRSRRGAGRSAAAATMRSTIVDAGLEVQTASEGAAREGGAARAGRERGAPPRERGRP